MTFNEIWHLAWIHNRLVTKHEENIHTDYMDKLYRIIEAELNKLGIPISMRLVPIGPEGTKNPSQIIQFYYSGMQP